MLSCVSFLFFFYVLVFSDLFFFLLCCWLFWFFFFAIPTFRVVVVVVGLPDCLRMSLFFLYARYDFLFLFLRDADEPPAEHTERETCRPWMLPVHVNRLLLSVSFPFFFSISNDSTLSFSPFDRSQLIDCHADKAPFFFNICFFCCFFGCFSFPRLELRIACV